MGFEEGLDVIGLLEGIGVEGIEDGELEVGCNVSLASGMFVARVGKSVVGSLVDGLKVGSFEGLLVAGFALGDTVGSNVVGVKVTGR